MFMSFEKLNLVEMRICFGENLANLFVKGFLRNKDSLN